ncbi:hypothetical protein PHSC3_000690 [Chlamydiales bacterium STE3]|nr:hypothetical protein PHSC3_000690 [Chlamydiales bacterium STE3]
MLKIFFALLMCWAFHVEGSPQYDFRATLKPNGEQFPLANSDSFSNPHHSFTTPLKLLHKEWNNFFENNPSDTMYLQTCHSQGAIPTRNALIDYPNSLRKRIFIVAVSPAAYIYTETCADVMHHLADPHRDGVPRGDFRELQRISHKVEMPPLHSDVSYRDSSMFSPVFKDKLRKHLTNYLNSGGKSM